MPIMVITVQGTYQRGHMLGQSWSHVQAGKLRFGEVKTLAQSPSGKWKRLERETILITQPLGILVGQVAQMLEGYGIRFACPGLTHRSRLQAQRPGRVLETSGSPADQPQVGMWPIRPISHAGRQGLQKSPFLPLGIWSAGMKLCVWVVRKIIITQQAGLSTRLPSRDHSSTARAARPREQGTCLISSRLSRLGPTLPHVSGWPLSVTARRCHVLARRPLEAGKGWVSKTSRKAHSIPSLANCWTFVFLQKQRQQQLDIFLVASYL